VARDTGRAARRPPVGPPRRPCLPLPISKHQGGIKPVAALAFICPFQERYDSSMTRSKIAISLPKDQLVRVHREVRAGRADSVSGYIARVLAEHERRESLRALLRDLIERYGEPAAEDVKWAERALAPRRG
jgi:hypothetical protein